MKRYDIIKKISVTIALMFILTGITASIGIGKDAVNTDRKISSKNLDDTVLFDSGDGKLIRDMAGSVSSSLGAIDYDNDGDLDFLEGADNFFNMETNEQGEFVRKEIYQLPNQGGYGDDLDRSPFPVGDFNNDGKQDFLVGGVQGIIRLFINNNSQPDTPNFTNYTIAEFGQYVRGIAVADFNDDGWLDFAASYATSPIEYSTITLFYNQGDLTFSQDNIYRLDDNYIQDLATGDFDNDGDIDLIFTKSIYKIKWDGWPINIKGTYVFLENNGNNSFPSERVIATRGHDLPLYYGIVIHQLIQQPIKHFLGINRFNPQMTTADFDNDGNLDFVVGDNSGKIELWLNDGQGNFESNGVINRYGHLSWGLTSGDFDSDGDIDLLVSALPRYSDFFEGQIWLKKNQLNP
jgi:hypothetical protein